MMRHVVVINPNTSASATGRMLEIARASADPRVVFSGLTAEFGAQLITDEPQLEQARRAVLALLDDVAPESAGVVVAAFGDPGLEDLRRALSIPVAGIGEAGLLAAAAGGRRFAVVTTTPGLVASIGAKVARLGLASRYAGTFLTAGDAVAIMADAASLESALAAAIMQAIGDGGADAVVIGGGPLAAAARALAPRFPIPIVEPIPAAIRWLEREWLIGA